MDVLDAILAKDFVLASGGLAPPWKASILCDFLCPEKTGFMNASSGEEPQLSLHERSLSKGPLWVLANSSGCWEEHWK